MVPALRYLALFAALGPLAAQAVTEQLKRQFQRFDANGSGTLERTEFPGSDPQFQSLDQDGDRVVTFEEYADSDVARRFARSSYRNLEEPRDRTTTDQLLLRRLAWLERFDADRNGRITAEEWTGTTLAFASLDANGDGVIDRKDIADAQGRVPIGDPRAPDFPWPEYEPPQFREFPTAESLLARLDRNRDEHLSRAEVARDPIARVFATVDRDGDDTLDVRELEGMLATIAARARTARELRREPVAFRVPFAVWDKNDDGKLELAEFAERKYLFGRIDADRDGAVTEDEVERYRRSIEGDSFVARFDLNGDGRVTLDEFGGSPSAFRRVDRNGDGVVDRRDR